MAMGESCAGGVCALPHHQQWALARYLAAMMRISLTGHVLGHRTLKCPAVPSLAPKLVPFQCQASRTSVTGDGSIDPAKRQSDVAVCVSFGQSPGTRVRIDAQ